jgi:hydrogenase nickel incorporation protein HypA/HybF
MHELSIALSILEIVGEQARLHGASRVVAVHLNLGPLSGVSSDALRSAYDLAREGSTLEEAALVITDVPLVVYCPRCAVNRVATSLQCLCCAHCGAHTLRIITGRELEIASLEIES